MFFVKHFAIHYNYALLENLLVSSIFEAVNSMQKER